MSNAGVQILKQIATRLRIDIIESLTKAGSGHLGASLGLADIFTVLYFNEMHHKPECPTFAERDKLILSIGHVAPVLYASLANAGYFEKDLLLTLRKTGSALQGHPHRLSGIAGIETSSGSLGQGLSIACGMAMADKYDMIDRRIFCIMGDGEIQEGQVWEAAMSASHLNLNKIVGIIDRNRVQIDGEIKQVMEIEPLKQKWISFGWDVYECNGNDISDILKCFKELQYKKPNLIIANTTMGKGVPEIENDYNWHGKVPDKIQAPRFIKYLTNQNYQNDTRF